MATTHPIINEWFKDPEFNGLPDEKKVQAIEGFFEKNLATDDFYKAPIEDQVSSRENFISSHMDQRNFEKAEPERGFLGDIASHTARGLVSLAEHGTQATKTLTGGSVGSDATKYLKNLPKTTPFLRPDVSEVKGEGVVKRGGMGAIESVPMTGAVFAGGLTGAKLGSLVLPGWGTVVGGLLGSGATMFGLFGSGVYGKRKDEVMEELKATRPDLSEAQIAKMSSTNALSHAKAEVLGEGISDAVAYLIFSRLPGGKIAYKGGKAILKDLVTPNAVKTIGKGITKSMPFEVGSEVWTAYSQHKADEKIGIEKGTALENMGEAIIPAMFLSGGLGIGIGTYSAQQRKAAYDSINHEDPGVRVNAINTVANNVAQATGEKEVAQKWLNAAMQYVKTEQNVPLDIGFSEFIAEEETHSKNKDFQALPKEENEQINNQIKNIISNGPEVIHEAIIQIDKNLNDFNNLLNDPELLAAKAIELDIPTEELTVSLRDQINTSIQLQERLKEESGFIEEETVDSKTESSTFTNEQQVAPLANQKIEDQLGQPIDEIVDRDQLSEQPEFAGKRAEESAQVFEAQRIKEERIRQSPEGKIALREQLIAEQKGEKTPFQQLIDTLYGKRWKYVTQELTEKEIEDQEFAEWNNKARWRTISEEEFEDAKKFVDRMEEDKAFRDWHIASQRLSTEQIEPTEPSTTVEPEQTIPDISSMSTQLPEFTETQNALDLGVKETLKQKESLSQRRDESIKKKIKLEEPITESEVAMEEKMDKFFGAEKKLTPKARKALEKQKKLIETSIASGQYTEDQLIIPRKRLAEINDQLPEINFEARENQAPGQGVQVRDIQKIFPGQNVSIKDNKQISVRLKNGKGITFENVKNLGNDFIEIAVQTGQMSKDGKILGVTVGNKILLDSEFADNKTLWHENKHVLDNLGIITKEDDLALNEEFNKLRKTGKLQFELSTHEEPIQRMKENRANTFAQIITSREEYRNTSFGKMIQKVMDFFDQLYTMGRRVVTGNQEFQTTSGLVKEAESGKLYARPTKKRDWFSRIQTMFPKSDVKEVVLKYPDSTKNGFTVKLSNGVILAIDPTRDFITFDRKKVSKDYRKTIGKNVKAHGKWRKEDNLIELLKDADDGTLAHEQFHALMDVMLNDEQKKKILTRYKTEEKAAEAFRRKTTETNSPLDFMSLTIDKVIDLFKGDVLQEVTIEAESGKLYERTFNDLNNEYSQPVQLSLKKAVKNILDNLNFVKWFEKSKVTDTNGKPLVVYHGTNAKFNKFKNMGGKTSVLWSSFDVKRQGFFFSPSKDIAGEFGENVMPVYLSIKNPIDLRDPYTPENIELVKKLGMDHTHYSKIEGWELFDDELGIEVIKAIKELGYDGAIIDEPDIDGKYGETKAYIAFYPTQIKSIYNTGAFASTDPNINFETREALPEQKIPDEQYLKMYQEKESLLKKIQQSGRMKVSDIKLMMEKSLTPISTRLKNINLKELSEKLRILDFKTGMQVTKVLKEAYPMMKKAKKMSSIDQIAWDLARKNSDIGKITQLAKKYDFEDNYNNIRETLDQIRQDAIDVGLDVGFIDDYWPRVLKDQEGFLQATQEISRRPIFTEAIQKKAKELDITVTELSQKYPDLRADIISNTILGNPSGISGPSNIQGRVFETIPDEYVKFYMDSDAALMQYVYSMTKKIEVRRFFGKVSQRISILKQRRNLAQTELIKIEKLKTLSESEGPINEEQQKLIKAHDKRIALLQENVKDYDAKIAEYKNQRDYTENISVYISDLMLSGKLHKKDEQAVRDILDARFHEKGTTGIVHAYKNISYIDVMGNPMAAITQIGDLAWAMYVGEIWNPLRLSNNIKNLTKAIFKKSVVTKESLGIERMAQEFADFDSLSNLVSKVFKYVGLERIDSIGKEFLINNAFDAYKIQASTKEGRIKLMKKLKLTFGDQANKVINELLALSKKSTANPSENIKMLLYSRLLDFQPVALSEMPENYLKGGNWRILYMLKTFTIKQFDVFRNEVWKDLKTGNAQQKLNAMKKMVQLMGILALANAGADEIKDFMLGKATKFSDIVIENFLTMGGANRFVRMQARREGLGTAVGQLVLPPFKFVNSLSKDIFSGEIIDPEKSRTLESLPFIGKLAYWHVGRGSEYRPSIDEQEFNKSGKKFRAFKKDFEETNDKRLFLQTNADDFKQMKIYENFLGAVKKITALINKLKKLDQTTNVRKRIGQLTEQQNQLRQRYFTLMENE